MTDKYHPLSCLCPQCRTARMIIADDARARERKEEKWKWQLTVVLLIGAICVALDGLLTILGIRIGIPEFNPVVKGLGVEGSLFVRAVVVVLLWDVIKRAQERHRKRLGYVLAFFAVAMASAVLWNSFTIAITYVAGA